MHVVVVVVVRNVYVDWLGRDLFRTKSKVRMKGEGRKEGRGLVRQLRERTGEGEAACMSCG